MRFNKSILANMLGVDTHEQELKLKQYELEAMADTIDKLNEKVVDLEKELAFHRLDDEEKLLLMRADIKGIEKTYIQRIQEADDMIELARQNIDIAEQKIHKAFADGRISGFSEVGIWRLDALERGNRLVLDKDGHVYELLQDLEDVEPSGECKVTDDEIIIDDLAGAI